jgi:WD40 repeat protein
VDALAFSPDGALLAAASEDSKINVWSVPGGTSVSR